MAYILEVKEEANLEIVEAYLYYEEKRRGLGEEFLEHLDIYFYRITTNPKHFPQKENLIEKLLLNVSHFRLFMKLETIK